MREMARVCVLAALLTAMAAGSSYAVSPVLKELEQGFIALHEQVRPCVVNIDTEGSLASEIRIEGYDDLFRFFGIPTPEGPNRRPRSLPRMSTGSGLIFDSTGHIITNNHVIQNAKTITCKLWDGTEYEAQVVGADPDTDLAVLKIQADRELPVARLGDSDQLKVGQFAVAVGSARGLEGSFSFGHVTALGRDELNLPGLRFQNFIQTDAAINLGNSGGPLCNVDGEVIGINIAIVYGANSLGFAIPSNTAKEIVPTLISEGKITRGYLGVGIVDVEEFGDAASLNLPDGTGAFVKTVQPGTPAERAAIRRYDVIRKVNGEDVEDSASLVAMISQCPPGSKVMLEVWREGKPIEVEVTLDEYAGSLEKAIKGKSVLGLKVETLTPELVERLKLGPGTAGVIVIEVEPGSAGDRAGLAQGDVITEVAQQKVTTTEEFLRFVTEKAVPGKSLLIGYLRDGGATEDITVIKVPKEPEIDE